MSANMFAADCQNILKFCREEIIEIAEIFFNSISDPWYYL